LDLNNILYPIAGFYGCTATLTDYNSGPLTIVTLQSLSLGIAENLGEILSI